MRFNRTCNNPTPSCRGLPCRGISVHEEPCNQHCCRGKIRKYGHLIRMYVARTIKICEHLNFVLFWS